MPQQEMFFKETNGAITVEVIKTYDSSYAREVFGNLDDSAKRAVAQTLNLTTKYEAAEIPDPTGFEYDNFLWEELMQDSLEDPRQYPPVNSFFVVTVRKDDSEDDCYVSADWPSAEAFAKARLAQLPSDEVERTRS